MPTAAQVAVLLLGPAIYLLGSAVYKTVVYGGVAVSHIAGAVMLLALVPVGLAGSMLTMGVPNHRRGARGQHLGNKTFAAAARGRMTRRDSNVPDLPETSRRVENLDTQERRTSLIRPQVDVFAQHLVNGTRVAKYLTPTLLGRFSHPINRLKETS